MYVLATVKAQDLAVSSKLGFSFCGQLETFYNRNLKILYLECYCLTHSVICMHLLYTFDLHAKQHEKCRAQQIQVQRMRVSTIYCLAYFK